MTEDDKFRWGVYGFLIGAAVILGGIGFLLGRVTA